MADELESTIVLLFDRKIEPVVLRRLLDSHFGNMVKFVVDIHNGWAAVGGELHADAEKVLLEAGSRQADIWGANYYPDVGPEDCVEYTSLINIRPSVQNPGMEVHDPAIRARVREITASLIGEGEPLP